MHLRDRGDHREKHFVLKNLCVLCGIVLLDLKGKVLKINRRIVDVSGFSEDGIVGKRFTLLKMFPLKHRIQMLAMFSKELAGINRHPLEVIGYNKAGEKVDVEIHGSVIKINWRFLKPLNFVYLHVISRLKL